MNRLGYAIFFSSMWTAEGLTVPQVCARINRRFGRVQQVRPLHIYEFLRGRSVPNAGLAKAIEHTFGVNLPPRMYGWGRLTKP